MGIALFLTHLAEKEMSCSTLRKQYPDYSISKNRIELDRGTDVEAVLSAFEKEYSRYEVNTVDGVKVDMPEGWVHLRRSNTEPIIRLYAEAKDEKSAEALADRAKATIEGLLN